MNVERTIRFILEQQAQTSALAAQIAAMAARQEKTDRQMAARP
jgi:hypothetical protein